MREKAILNVIIGPQDLQNMFVFLYFAETAIKWRQKISKMNLVFPCLK